MEKKKKKMTLEQIQKKEKTKKVIKWVITGVLWTCLLSMFIGLFALGVKGCNEKKKQTSRSQNTIQETMIPQNRSYIDSVYNLFGKTYGVNRGFTAQDSYSYEIRAVVRTNSIGQFEYYDDNEQYYSGAINGFGFNNNSSRFEIYDLYGNTYLYDYRQLDDDQLNPFYELELYTFSVAEMSVGIEYNQAVISYTNQFLTQFNYCFTQTSDNQYWNMGLYSDLNDSIALVLNRTYFQSDIVGNSSNGLIAGTYVDTLVIGNTVKLQDKHARNNFHLVEGSEYGSEDIPIGTWYYYFPTTITYTFYEGLADIGYGGPHQCDGIVSLYRYYDSTTKTICYFLGEVYFYDYDYDDGLYVFECGQATLISTKSDIKLGICNFDYSDADVNNQMITFYTGKITNEYIRCLYIEAYRTNYGYYVPFGLTDTTMTIPANPNVARYIYTQGKIDCLYATRLIYNDDFFIGENVPIADDNTDQVVSNVFSLLSNAFMAMYGIFSIVILPGITLGTLIFIPLTISVVLFVVWLIKR